MYGCAISLLFLTIAITWYPNREGLQERQVRKKLESAISWAGTMLTVVNLIRRQNYFVNPLRW